MQARDRIGDRYELTYPVGRGGMGQVWAGYDERLDRPVAVKFLRQMEVPEDGREAAVKRFRREARVTARLDHPGVPAVHDLGQHGDDLYLVMQLVPGMVLADLIAEEEELPVAQSASIAAQVCDVLAAAHAASLVHRDLKPQNLMITPADTVKVLDFGVAALLDPAEASRLTATGHTLGTPAYIAPEQAEGGTVGPGTDLYALGCILFEMLTGRPPYEAKTALDMLHQHRRGPIPIVTEYRRDVPDDLAHLLFCLLAKDPAERPASAAEVGQLLAQFTDGKGTRNTAVTTVREQPAVALTQQAAETPGQLHARALELAEEERFVQAAEMLAAALAAHQSPPLDDATRVRLRFELATLRMLGGNSRDAQHDFEVLARDVEGRDSDLADECRRRARACQSGGQPMSLEP
ncbi:serine/threonine-protein kinase [Micromonospora chersina]|uniref:serine/threonine-protein kinase n=1 Tax=Micromonospora chersina TaxID=47854 RepID=UPI0037A2A460